MDYFIVRLKIFFIFFIPLIIMGCGSSFTPISDNESLAGMQSIKPFGTCDRKAVSLINVCTEVIGIDYNDNDYLSVLQTNCEATGGVFSTINCDATGSSGSCLVDRGQTNEVFTIYYPPLYSQENAQSDCETHGGEFHKN